MRNCNDIQSGYDSDTGESISPRLNATRTNGHSYSDFEVVVRVANFRPNDEPWIDSLSKVAGPGCALVADAAGCFDVVRLGGGDA